MILRNRLIPLCFLSLFWASTLQAQEWTLIHEIPSFLMRGPNGGGLNINRHEQAIVGDRGANSAFVFDTLSGQVSKELRSESSTTDFGRAVTISTHYAVATDSATDTLHIFDLELGSEILSIEASDFDGDEINGRIAIDGANLAFYTHDGNLNRDARVYNSHIFDIGTGQETRRFPNGQFPKVNGNLVAYKVQDEPETVVVELASGEEIYRVSPVDGPGTFEHTMSDAHLLLWDTTDDFTQSFLYLFDSSTGELLRELDAPAGLDEARIAGEYAIVSYHEEPTPRVFTWGAQILDINSGKVVFDFPDVDSPPDVAIGDVTAVFAPRKESGDQSIFVAALTSSVLGDFNHDALISTEDIDVLTSIVRAGANGAFFDLTADGLVSELDRSYWIEEVAESLTGDANLDKLVDFSDFLALSGSFGQTAGWADGDFDGSGDVAFADFLLLAENFGKTASAVASVPEPSGSAMSALVGLVILSHRKRRRTVGLASYRLQ